MAAIIRRDGVRSFVLFTVGGMGLALPLDGVLEILRPPVLVPIPLGPPSLEGLARRHGAVLPVIGLRRVLELAGAEEGEADDGETTAARLLIVRHNGQPVGLLVDRVSGLSAVDEDRIADAGAVPDPSIDADLLAGAILARDGRDGALILDPAPLIERQFSDFGRSPAGIADFGASPQPKTAAEPRLDEEQLVVLTVAEQDFSLPVAAVREVVPVPETVTRVPRARAHLLGMMTLRDALLPLIGLRELFGLDAEVDSTADRGRGKVAVLRTAEGLVGVVVEDVREILRVPRERIDAVPPLMAREAEFEDMDGIARLDGGARLIPVLSAERLFRHGVGDGAGMGGDARMREGEAAVVTEAERAEAFVVFRLAGAEYGLPVAAVQEVLRRPDAVTPLPNAPEFVSGVTTLRGAVLPLVALRRLLRLPEGRGSAAERGRVVVIAAGTARAGLLVDAMAGIVRIPGDAIAPAPVVSQAQHRLIRRIGALESAGERRMILLMDPAELLDMDQLADLLATV
ncbi:chemotaxis protein CheW [Azospirillum formosense]|uniref:Chemotaxis protein CheW n=1 Tax=Azospirillum formosense TaxID=861533 RepID=A0ABX2KVL0_9PROT|nr:chemotaxis protein CheW [Azospirillum formosense]MBY3756151.1 chemotaxis protein CheW [Azospirillum formosense]NUB17866.1 chemotaxis protein CheW [Azospirillum formosense]